MPKQKKKPDPGHEETERMIREMEQKVAKEYAQAEKDMQKKLDKYFERFAVKDARKKAAVDAGTLSEEKYLEWRKNQLLIGDRWKEMRSNIALDLHNSNRIARSIVNSYMPDAYAANFNYGVFQVEKLAYANTAFTLYNREAIERILKDNPQILPPPGQQMKNTFGEFDAYKKAKEEGKDIKIDPKKQKAFDKYIKNNRDIRWQEGQLQSVVTQAVLQGESIPNMARRIANTMGEMNRKATTRYARTAMTEAQSAGRVNAYKRCKDMGIDVSQQWMATHDAFTRDTHVMLDGEIREIGKPFSNGCEYPGDPNGRPAEIWNCRCTLVPVLNKYKHFGTSLAYKGKIDGMTYEEWKAAHAEKIKGRSGTTSAEEVDNRTFAERVNAILDEARQSSDGITTETIQQVGRIFASDLQSEHLAPLQQNFIDAQERREAFKRDNNIDSERYHKYLMRKLSSKDLSMFSEDERIKYDKLDALQKEYNAAYSAFYGSDSHIAYMKNKISEIRSVGFTAEEEKAIKAHLNNSRSPMRKIVEEAYGMYPSDWVHASMARGNMDVRKVQRGYYSDFLGEIAISGSNKTSQRETAVHELGHRFERAVPKIKEQEKLFYNKRTDGEELKWLDHGYGKGEKTRKDDFISPYMGKDYGGDAYELVSMGFQYAYTDPARLAKDPDMQSWILGMLLCV